MNPDQLRTAAQHLTLAVPLDDEEHDRVAAATGDPDWWAALTVARDATRTLAAVVEHIEDEAHRLTLGRPLVGINAYGLYAEGEVDSLARVLNIIDGDPFETEPTA